MDPVGPWSAYASYNRLTGVQENSSEDVHPQLAQSGTPPTTTAQAVPSGFIAPTGVGYETVFSPLFHPSASKPPVQYVTQVVQQRPVTQGQSTMTSSKPSTEGEYQGQAYFEQSGGSWQQNSPFGVLPHESVVPTTAAGKSATYENFNAHFAAAQSLNQLNTQLVSTNSTSTAPHVQPSIASKSTPQSNSTFFQVPVTFSNSEASNSTKSFVSSDVSNLQQSCIVTSPANVSNAPNCSAFLSSSEKPFTALSDKPTVPQIQTKAQTKIYPDLNNQGDRQRTNHDDNQTQSAPISFSLDAPGCLNYASNNNATKRTPFQSSNYRHYQPGNNTETDFQRTKALEYSNSNGSDCSGINPRQTSPLQTHSQASPLGHAQSPAYPMYNSPMNSIPSPQQTSNNQVTSPSPLDATISRSNSQTGNVAYSSVITRTLNNGKKFPDHYDRSLQQQPPQDCWDERQVQLQRKFQTHSTLPTTYASINNLDMSQRVGDSCQQRNVGNQDRQQTYFNTSQIPLQDLASCRGDPISLVKNMQQQTCQIPQLDVKSQPKTSNKRRKSNEKLQHLPNEISQGPAMAEYFAGRLPPPAHSSASTQQQNGAYFDYDRWNLPPSKMFAPQGIHQQHQGIMVSHPHHPPPPPALSYFPPFHLSTHPEYPSGVEYTPPVYNEQSNQQSAPTQVTEENDQPKVVVPNIEEELNFLSGGTTKKTTNTSQSTSVMRPTIVNQVGLSDRTSGSAGFMNSYLKFLQGDRDSSPPIDRGNRKQSWSRSKPVQPTNGVLSTPISQPPPPPTIPAARLSQGDPQDDPRYFPLPKERKKDRFNSSDDGFSSEDDLFNKKVNVMKSDFFKDKRGTRGKARNVNRRTSKKVQPKKDKEFEPSRTPTVAQSNAPRRESSRRAAKEKTNLRKIIAEEELDQLDYIDSDSDPAWSPKRNDDDEVVAVMKKGRRNGGKKRSSQNLITAAAQCAGINDLDGYTSDGKGNIKNSNIAGTLQVQEQGVAPILQKNAMPLQQPAVPAVPIENPFKHGEFLVMKTDLDKEWPPIWRVDGKALLQRYEPFEQNGKMLYKNIQTYTSWTPDSIKQYTSVRVNFKVQSSTEIIVEFLRKDVVDGVELTIIEKSMETNKVYQDNFEVYIQTLISQALDNNFLTEIFQEQDDYFLSNVKTIDDITDNQKHKMIYLLQWPKAVLIAINTWPCFNVINEFNTSNSLVRPCAACLKPGVAVRVLMFGQPYNSTTLEACQPDSFVEKDFFMCRPCGNQVELINKITHQKYLMYVQCAKKVAEKRLTDPNKDTTCILNELLADEAWLSKLFNDVRHLWGEVDSLEYRYKVNSQCGDSSNKTVL